MLFSANVSLAMQTHTDCCDSTTKKSFPDEQHMVVQILASFLEEKIVVISFRRSLNANKFYWANLISFFFPGSLSVKATTVHVGPSWLDAGDAHRHVYSFRFPLPIKNSQ
jgi:hypothetical protein